MSIKVKEETNNVQKKRYTRKAKKTENKCLPSAIKRHSAKAKEKNI